MLLCTVLATWLWNWATLERELVHGASSQADTHSPTCANEKGPRNAGLFISTL